MMPARIRQELRSLVGSRTSRLLWETSSMKSLQLWGTSLLIPRTQEYQIRNCGLDVVPETQLVTGHSPPDSQDQCTHPYIDI